MSQVASRKGEAGFSLVEMMIAMIIGVALLVTSTGLVMGTIRSLTGSELRDAIDRNARFMGIALQRDIQQTGIGLDSRTNFGTIGTFADTLVVLWSPYLGTPEDVAVGYPRSGAGGGFGIGNCGALCLQVQVVAPPFQIAVGDLAYVSLNADVRRLVRVTAVDFPSAGVARVTIANTSRILGHDAGIADINLGGAFTLRTIRAVAFYRNAANELLRATSVSTAGAAQGQVLATNVQSWDTSLQMLNGAEITQANGLDASEDNDYDKIGRVHVVATLRAERADPRVNNGALLTQTYEWWFAPRNLMYERNRD